MLKWSDRARIAIKKLFEPLQEIDVYVEDTNDEVFYRTLLKAATGGKIQVARVFGLGGHEAVVAAAKTHDHSRRRALFIVDGDLPWVLGTRNFSILGLHCHDAYCIENLLVCEKAVTSLLAQEAVLTEVDAAKSLDFKTWIASIQSPLIELFAAFATAYHFASGTRTVSFGVGKLCVADRRTKSTALNGKKVDGEKARVLVAAVREVGNDAAHTVYTQTLERLRALKFPLNAVSGKDFLLPLLDFHLQAFGCRVKRASLRMRLASAGDVTRFAALSSALERAARGYSER